VAAVPPGLAPGSRATYEMMERLGLLEAEAGEPTVAGVRRSAAAEAPLHGEPPPVARVEEQLLETAAGPLPVRAYWPRAVPFARQTDIRNSPAGEPERAILWLHGGGWVIGDLGDCDVDCRRLCAETSSLVVAPEYRLAPEHPFPAGLEDCFAALAWLAGELGDGYPPLQLLVGGDSAGGNLAAALTLLARQRGGPRIDRQLLIYPVADDDFETASYREFGEGCGLSAESMRLFWRSYVGAGEAPELAAVLRAPDLRGLPPAIVVVAGADVLRDEGEAYAARLRDAAVPVDVLRYPGELHGFWSYGAVSAMPGRVNADLLERLRGGGTAVHSA
jgi:acetyl esterase